MTVLCRWCRGGASSPQSNAGSVTWHFGIQRAVASAERQVGGRRADAIAEVGVAPTEFADDRPRVRIEQQLVVIEAVAARRVVWPVAAVSIKLPRSDVGKIAV